MKQEWPDLPFESWRDTYETLHLYTQVVGKIRMVLTPLVNHFWNVSFQVGPRGLTTGSIPWGEGAFSIAFDFLDHNLVFESTWGQRRALALVPRSVAHFESEVHGILHSMGIVARYSPIPVEIPGYKVPFSDDEAHATYDPEAATDWWRILVRSQRLMEIFRARFLGKCSPVHFFWGSFDLAVTRFSGRRAPLPDDAGWIRKEAYSHEVSSVGIWPGDASLGGPAFYAYQAPMPEGFDRATVRPSQARWDREKGEFLLDYEDVRLAPDPDRMVLEFFQSTWEAGADLAGWDRQALERPLLEPAAPGELTFH